MLLDWNTMKEITIPHLNGGDGAVSAKMSVQPNGKLMLAKIEAGASIGMHAHPSSADINYVISGTGRAVCDGAEEELTAGSCHVCPQGSSHSIVNTGTETLVLFTVVPEL